MSFVDQGCKKGWVSQKLREIKIWFSQTYVIFLTCNGAKKQVGRTISFMTLSFSK